MKNSIHRRVSTQTLHYDPAHAYPHFGNYWFGAFGWKNGSLYLPIFRKAD